MDLLRLLIEVLLKLLLAEGFKLDISFLATLKILHNVAIGQITAFQFLPWAENCKALEHGSLVSRQSKIVG